MDDFKRFDMSLPPVRTKWYLRPLTLALSLPDVLKHKTVITKTGMEGIKPPYVLLCNHNAFMDFKVATKALWPARANYVVAIDGFIGRETLLRNVGCICKRKFTNDLILIRQLQNTIKNGDIAIIYPEARYSLCGTTAVLPEALGKMCRLFGVPVVSLICHGHHVNSPFWNLHDRGVKPTEAELSLLFTPEQLKTLPVDELNARIVERFQYDDHKWQKDRGIRITYPKRAEGLHKVLYQCASCGTEYSMISEGDKLICKSCGKKWTLTELGELKADEGKTVFSHIPDWYEWERGNVRAEVESGTYTSGELEVHVSSLPNADRFIDIGTGTMTHDMNGFRVMVTDNEGTVREMEKSVPSLYSCHIEYPHGERFAVTKMALATEELFALYRKNAGRPCKPGLM